MDKKLNTLQGLLPQVKRNVSKTIVTVGSKTLPMVALAATGYMAVRVTMDWWKHRNFFRWRNQSKYEAEMISKGMDGATLEGVDHLPDVPVERAIAMFGEFRASLYCDRMDANPNYVPDQNPIALTNHQDGAFGRPNRAVGRRALLCGVGVTMAKVARAEEPNLKRTEADRMVLKLWVSKNYKRFGVRTTDVPIITPRVVLAYFLTSEDEILMEYAMRDEEVAARDENVKGAAMSGNILHRFMGWAQGGISFSRT